MKISNLLENSTPASSTDNTNTSAPKFGRSNKFLENEKTDVKVEESDCGTSTSAGIASVSAPIGGVQRRGKGSMLKGIKTSAKYPNSVAVKEGAYEDGVNDGMRGEANPRASSIYGPESGEYSRGYKDGLVKGKEQHQANIDKYKAELAPYKEIDTEDLKQMLRDIRKRSDETQAIFDKYRGASRFGGDVPPNVEELKKQGAIDSKAWQAIHQELFQRGVPQEQRMDEADEWEEDTDKRERFLQYAKQKLITAKKNNQGNLIDLANALSVQDNKIFGSPFINTDVRIGLGAVNVSRGEKFTKAISTIMNWLNSGQGMAQVTAQQAAVWLQPHGKEFLERVHSDLLGMQDNSEDQRIKHAIALSGYQVEHMGGKVRGSFKGDYSTDPADNMTQEVYDIYKVVEIEIAILHQQRRDAQELADQKKIWESIPMPIKVAMAASHGMTPGQMEAMLFGKTEADKIAGYFNNSNQHQEEPEKELAEGNPFLQQHGFGGGKFPEPRKPRPDGMMSKSEVLGKDGLVYHWQDPRAKQGATPQGVGEAKKANTKTARQEFGKRPRAELSDKEKEQKKSESDEAWERLMAYAASQKKEKVDEKSVSQAQFRTMAAAAHNPKFAKKVGISQKVGKEFHKADRKQDYKDLPAKVEATNPAQQAAIAIAKKKEQGVAEGSDELYQKAIRKYAQRVANDYLGGGNEYLYGANKFDSEMFGVDPKQAQQDFETWFAQYKKGTMGLHASLEQHADDKMKELGHKFKGVAEGLPQTLRKVVPGYAKREIDKKMDAGKFGKTDADKDANFQRYKKIQDKLKEQGVAEAGEWTKLPNGNWRNMHTGAQQSTPPKTKKPRRTMGLHASLEQHADDKMKELGHKFKPVDEARVGNRMSDISVGSPKIVHYKGKAVGEVGIDHDPSPGNGPYYFHHYLTGKAYVGYDTKQQALADLKSIVMQVDDKELEEEKQRLDPKCWTGYKKQGTKMKGGVRVNNCVPVNEAEFTEDKLAQDLYRDLQIFKKGADKDIGQKAKSKDLSSKAKDKDIVAKEDWQKVNKGDKTDGMSSKAVKAYRRENPGSKLKTAVTTKPSKLKAGSKDAKRRKSFCARMSGVEGPMKDEHGKPTPKAKALKRWNC